jgi:hypothetical protein
MDIFTQNSYSDRQIRRALKPTVRAPPPSNKPDPVAFVPYIGLIFIRIVRMMSRHIKSVGLPPRKIAGFLQSDKDELGLKTPRVYGIRSFAVGCTLKRQAVQSISS